MKMGHFLKQFNWRFLLVRILVNAIALAVTAAIVPKIYFVDKSIWSWLLMAFMLGVLNALVKPILQILTLQYLFVTYGLVTVLVNTLILLLLSALFPGRFAVDNLLWAFVGGLVLGLLSSFLESLLGLTMPIVSDEPPELRQQIEEQARHADWLATRHSQAAVEAREQASEPLAPERTPAVDEKGQGREGREDVEQEFPADASAPDAGAPEIGSGEAQIMPQPRVTTPEPSTPEAGEELASSDSAPAGEGVPSLPQQGGAEATGPATSSAEAAAAAVAEAAIPAGTEPAHETQEEAREEPS